MHTKRQTEQKRCAERSGFPYDGFASRRFCRRLSNETISGPTRVGVVNDSVKEQKKKIVRELVVKIFVAIIIYRFFRF